VSSDYYYTLTPMNDVIRLRYKLSYFISLGLQPPSLVTMTAGRCQFLAETLS